MKGISIRTEDKKDESMVGNKDNTTKRTAQRVPLAATDLELL